MAGMTASGGVSVASGKGKGEKKTMPVYRPVVSLVLALSLLLWGLAAPPATLAATVSVPCASDLLIKAITEANARSEATTLQLAPGCTYTLTAVDNLREGFPNGLPAITGELMIEGRGAIIERSLVANTPSFRLFLVAGGSLTINNLTVRNGYQPQSFGGGLANIGGFLTVNRSTISGNRANEGGGIGSIARELTITSSTIANNSATTGGGILNAAGLRATNSTITTNTAQVGGGIANRGGMNIIESRITNNTALLLGAGVHSVSGATIDRSRVANNTGRQASGIFNSGGFLLTQSTVSGNKARLDGGGVQNTGFMSVTNSTVAFNSTGGRGGGIDTTGELTLASSTLAGNRAISGGGLVNSHAATTLTNTLIAGNRAAGSTTAPTADCRMITPIPGASHTLVGRGTGCPTGGSGNLTISPATVFVTVLERELADNGGPTRTLALRPGSPAIDAGDTASCPATDQRGIERPQGVACDIGAFEAQP